LAPVPEGFLEFCLHGFLIRLLNQKFGAELAKFGKLDLARAVLEKFVTFVYYLLK
jgi:hypothetical protein